MVIEIKELKKSTLASITVNCENPEYVAWNKMRAWAKENLADYQNRQYFGCAQSGQHPEGEEHKEDEKDMKYPYCAQVVLRKEDDFDKAYTDIDIVESSSGMYIVGDIDLLNNGDMGKAMEEAYFKMTAWLKRENKYSINLQKGPVLEEHIFNEKWTSGDEGLSGFKLWLPIE